MARRLIFNPSIPADLTAALEYYDAISPALGDRFRSQVEQRLDDIAVRPESFPLDVFPIRFANIDQFPYLIFFSLKSDIVSVIAIAHGSSKPDVWRNRE